MYLKQLELNSFRNYEKLSLDLYPNINILYGNNAQGKTNLLEAIYFLGFTKSHRCSCNENLIKYGSEISNVSGLLENNGVTTNIFIGFTATKKNLKINNNIISKTKDYVSIMSIITFSPDDLELIKGSPEIRRKYLNAEISQISSSYLKLIDDYNKLLKMRNECLNNYNNTFDKSYFNIITSYLVERVINIYKYRKNYFEKINSYISDIFYKISGFSNFSIKYIPNIDINYDSENIREDLLKKYEEIYDEEKSAGKTLIGPQKDEFDFIVNRKSLKMFGSQGQQRMSVIALKLSELVILKKIKNSNPIILLDDVFSELDDLKKNNLLEYIDNSTQVIITTTDLNKIDDKILKKACIIKVCNGNIEKVEKNGTK